MIIKSYKIHHYFKNINDGQVGTVQLYRIVVEHVVVMDVLYFNSMVNYYIRKTILSGDAVLAYNLYK